MRPLFLIVTLICFSINIKAQIQELNAYFTAHQKLNQFNGNVLVAKNNKVVFQNTFNINSVTDNFKITLKSKFIIASVSKVFIKTAILKLSEQSKLNITDTIGKFIPNFPNGNVITIEHLLLHKSGLPREITDYEKHNQLNLLQVIDLAKKEKLLFNPGINTAYSNVGYFILHYIIQQASGKKYAQYMQTEIFKNLKLRNTDEYNNLKIKTAFAYGFTTENDTLKPSEIKNINQFETGNIITTISDLFLFSKQITNKKFLNKNSKKFLFHPDSTLIQAGGRPGYRAYLYINLKNKTTFILQSNQSNIPFDEIIKETTNILEGKTFTLPKSIIRTEIKLPSTTLNKYIGHFVSKEHNLNFKIQILDNNLIIEEPNGNQTKLFAEDENSFFDSPKSKDIYSFLINEKKEITGFQIFTNGMKIVLKKLQ
ncbi:MAG: serine hydrolase domain-containing protein [Limnohabitans sp.]|nr:serine hydrolase domain-containing protein [Limnohabitans sp.]